jgi:hypothetical protein
MKMLVTLLIVVAVGAVSTSPAFADDGTATIDTSQKIDALELTKLWALEHPAPPPSETATIADRLAFERAQDMLDRPSALPAELSLEWLKSHGLDGNTLPDGLSVFELESIENARELAGLPPLFENSDDVAKWAEEHPGGKDGSKQDPSATSTGDSSGGSHGADPADHAPDHPDRSGTGGDSTGTSSGDTKSQTYHVEVRQDGKTVAEGTKTVTETDTGRTEVTTTTDNDGNTTTTTDTYDKDGNLTSSESTTTEAGGDTTTDECTDNCYTTPDQDTTVYFAGPAGPDKSLVTLHQQLEHPSNVDDGTGGDAGPVDPTRTPYYGKVDPSPENDTTGVVMLGGNPGGSTVVNHFNAAGPEFGPDGPQTTDTSGPLDPNQGNGPISIKP